MPEPAKDTAIDIAPKTQPTQGRVPKIVAEINRATSRVRDRNKKDHDAEVLENDAPTPSPRPTETIRIMRENTHRRREVDKVIVGLLVFISILLVIGCVLLGLVLKDERTKSSPPPPPPSPPPLKLPPPPPLPYHQKFHDIPHLFHIQLHQKFHPHPHLHRLYKFRTHSIRLSGGIPG